MIEPYVAKLESGRVMNLGVQTLAKCARALGASVVIPLRDVFKEVEKLPEAEQEQLAAAIRAELEAETAWESRLAASKRALQALADEALAEHRAGRTLPLDPDNL